MRVLLVLVGIAIAAGIGIAFVALGGDSDSNNGISPSPTSVNPFASTPSPVPTPPNISELELDREEPFDLLDAPPVPTVAFGPYLVASDALDGGPNSAYQRRVFRTSDDTVAVLYHRPARVGEGFHDIVIVHSHDGGQTWHGETVLSTERADATYSGVIDPDGNIHVAYGREAEADRGGAIKVRSLKYDPADRSWTPGENHRVVWDWPGQGAGMPLVTLTDDRLWLSYLLYKDGVYSYVIRHADPDQDGEYSASMWSDPFTLVPGLDQMAIQPSLVTHNDSLSLFFSASPLSNIGQRILADPIGNPEVWGELRSVFQPFERGHIVRYSVASDDNGRIHLVTSGEGLFISHMVFNGSDWTTPTQLAVNNVYGPSVVSNGEDIWTFWVKKQLSGYNQVQIRRWIDGRYWERTASTPWAAQFGLSNPSVLLYRARSDNFSDITRYAGTLASADVGVDLTQFFERVGDFVYVGSDTPFSVLPLSMINETESTRGLLQYWNGSQWADLSLRGDAHDAVNGNGAANGNGSNGRSVDDMDPLAADKAISFDEPSDWQRTEVNGIEKYYLRINSDAGDALKIKPLFGLAAPTVSVAMNNVIDLLIAEDLSGDKERRLWFGAISSDSINAPNRVVEHKNKTTAPDNVIELSDFELNRPIPLPEGSFRQYISVEIDTDETFEYQLLDGQIRSVKVLRTDLQQRSSKGVTVWGTATVEVSGPGIRPERANIPAAYFQSPVVLNGVRIFVEITKDFNDFRLTQGGGTSKAARLMLSDARYSMTDLTQYRWPFPGMLWGMGPWQHYYQGLQGTANDHSHSTAFSQSMPSRTAMHAWHDGTVLPSTNGTNWLISLDKTGDGRGRGWHQANPLVDLNPDVFSGEVVAGQQLGVLPDTNGAPRIEWGSGSEFDWAPVLAEWYMAESTAITRSYVKDWLVLGPFDTSGDFELGTFVEGDGVGSAIGKQYLPGEAEVFPEAGDAGPDNLVWKRFDNILPGVVNVAEAVSGYPNSGWASVNGNSDYDVAFFATYVFSSYDRVVTFNFGSSDAIKVWVDDEVVFEKDTYVRVSQAGEWSVIPDFDKARVGLHEGWNRVLIKLSQERTNFLGTQAPQNAWQLTFRVSDALGNPVPGLSISPDKDRRFAPVEHYALLSPTDRAEVQAAKPPEREHAWPETADLTVGEKFVFSMLDGSVRTLELISYDRIIPRQLITATVLVSGNGKTETHTLRVSPGGVPVAINGLRVFAYAWKEADDFDFEFTQAGRFPLTPGKDVGFAVNDATFTLFPNMDDFVYPYEAAFHEGNRYQNFLEPSGNETSWAHAGVDIAAPEGVNFRAIHDGVLWYKEINDPAANGQAALATTTGDQFSDPWTWFWTHLTMVTPKVANGTFVKKGTVIFENTSLTHMGTVGRVFDFGAWAFLTEIWNNEHKDDYPAPRYWLTLGAYQGDINSNMISANESGDLPAFLQPREGAPDNRGNRQWDFFDNHVNSLVRIDEIANSATFSGYTDRTGNDSLMYKAAYIYSPREYSEDEVMLTVGSAVDSKVWLNGETVFDTQANNGTPVAQSGNTDNRLLLRMIDEYDVPIRLNKGWNTLIAKSDTTGYGNTVRLFSARIGDKNGRRLPDTIFSTRSINLEASRLGNGLMELNWNEPDHTGSFTDSYRLDVALDAAFTDLVIEDQDLGKVTSHIIEGLESGVEYYVRVKPYNSSDMGGSVNWHLMDVVNTAASGGSSPVSRENASGTSEPNVQLTINSPAQGATINGDRVTVEYSTLGDMDQVGHVLLELDGDPRIADLLGGNQYQFINVSAGRHIVMGWLVDEAGNRIESSMASVSFDTSAPSRPGGISWLSTEGNKIVDEFGNTVVLRGVNIENREWIWDETKSIDYERRAIPVAAGDTPTGWGANVVTLAVASGPVNRNDSTYLLNLDELVALARSNNAYVLLVYRTSEPNEDQPPMPDQAAQAAMASLAQRYKNEPAVIYGLQVEPHNITWGELKPRFTTMIDAIRSVNSRALIVVPGTNYGRMIHYVIGDPIHRPNLVYKTHTYDTWATIEADYLLAEVAERYPVLIGEFGAGNSMSLGDTNLLLKFAEENGISWIGWLFNSVGCPCMLSNSETFAPSPYGTLIKTRLEEAAEAAKPTGSINLSLIP